MNSNRLIIFALLWTGTGCAAETSGLPSEIANTTINGTEYGSVTLSDGVWEGEPWVEGGAARPRLGLQGDFLRQGDIDGDGDDEYLVVVWQSSGGSGTYNYLALLDKEDESLRNTRTVALGDRIKVLDGSMGPNRIEIEVLEHDENDPACCPTRHAARHFDASLAPLEITERNTK